jgi:hypothetical protein
VDPQAASLGRLICEIGEASTVLTQEWWIGLWDGDEGNDPHWRQRAEMAWADQFGGEVGAHLDPAIPVRDLAELRDGSQKVKDYVDRNVAHLDARMIPAEEGPPTEEPAEAPTRRGDNLTLNEVHDAIDLVGRLFCRYGNLLTAASWVDLTPTIQHDWEAVFRLPWMEDDEE